MIDLLAWIRPSKRQRPADDAAPLGRRYISAAFVFEVPQDTTPGTLWHGIEDLIDGEIQKRDWKLLSGSTRAIG